MLLLWLRQWRYREAVDLFDTAAALLDTIGPGEEGAADLPRARALLLRHRGRALRGLGRLDEARELLDSALRAFGELDGPAGPGDRYNAARTLTDLADTFSTRATAPRRCLLMTWAIGILTKEGAEAGPGPSAAAARPVPQSSGVTSRVTAGASSAKPIRTVSPSAAIRSGASPRARAAYSAEANAAGSRHC